MIKAANVSTRTRREMLAGASATLLSIVAIASGQSATKDPDSELFALCVQYKRTEAELDGFYKNVMEPDPGSKAAYEFWNAELTRLYQDSVTAFDLVLTRPAKTLEGLAAKAKALTVNIERTEPSLGSAVIISDKRLEMAYALAGDAMKLAKVQP